MEGADEQERREDDWTTTRHAFFRWWNGGESSRQKLRRAMGVYRHSEGFERPDSPKYHWTAAVIRKPLVTVRNNLGIAILMVVTGVVAGLVLLMIERKWFAGD